MAATPKPIRKQMEKARHEHKHKSKNDEIHKQSYGELTKQNTKKTAHKLVKHMNKLNVFESPKHEKKRKEERMAAHAHMKTHGG